MISYYSFYDSQPTQPLISWAYGAHGFSNPDCKILAIQIFSLHKCQMFTVTGRNSQKSIFIHSIKEELLIKNILAAYAIHV